jgi:WD40 repeat protein
MNDKSSDTFEAQVAAGLKELAAADPLVVERIQGTVASLPDRGRPAVRGLVGAGAKLRLAAAIAVVAIVAGTLQVVFLRPTGPGSPTIGPTESASTAATSPSRPVAAGTQCGATAAFGGPIVALPLPSPTRRENPPTWSAQAAAFAIASVAASPDGQLLAIASATDSSNTAQLWADGSKLATLADSGGPVTCLAWSPDSLLLAGASHTGDVMLWNRGGQLVRTLHGTDPVFSLAWSPEGGVLATGAIHFPAPTATGLAALPGVVRLWSRDGSLNRTLGTESTGGKFLNLAWSPDGSMLAAGAGDYNVWRADGTQVGVLRTGGTPAWAMVWSPDGRALAIGDESGVLQIVTPDGTMQSVSSFEGDVNAVSYSPDGASLAVGHDSIVSVVKATDGRTGLWSVAAVAAYTIWSIDGHKLLISAADGLTLVGVGGAPSSPLTGCPGDVSAFSWDGAVVVAATDTGWLCSWRSPSA